MLFFRLNYIFRPGDNVFFVFNPTTQPGSAAGDERDHALMIKWTYSFDF